MNILSRLIKYHKQRNNINLNKESVEEVDKLDDLSSNNTADNLINLLSAASVFIFIILFYYYTSKILSILICTLYPVYGSITALDNEPGDRIRWLKYWISYAFVCFLDPFLAFFIGSFPIYIYMKICFFIWLMVPNNNILNGLDLFYDSVALPLYFEVSNYLNTMKTSLRNSENNSSAE